MPRTVSTAIVGAGFGGVAAAAALRRQGQSDIVILERGDRVGGVWRANTYPGIACDVPSNLYSLSFAPNPRWSRRFSPGEEIQEYLEDLVRRLDLERHLRLGADVVRAAFDEDRGRWRIELGDGDEVEAEVLVTACGQLTRPAIPDLPGMGDFEGEIFHSAHWPEGRMLDGARVAVIGTGASAIQFVPEIAPRVENMTIFQRSAPWIIPKNDKPYARSTKRLYAHVPILQRIAREILWAMLEGIVPVFTRRPGAVGAAISAQFRAISELQRSIQLRGDRRLMAATRPDYPVGCKRVLLSSDWYPALRRENVDLVTAPIREVVSDGVVTEGGTRHPVDTIVFGTGFTATEFLAPMEVRGRDGVTLAEAWRDGAEAYLGMTIPGFPNLFLLYGPNTNHGTGSALELIETQAGYVADAVRMLADAEAERLEVRRDVHEAFQRELGDRLRDSVWVACSSWYVTESGRVTNNWPGSQTEYRRRAGRLDPADYLLEPEGIPRLARS
jgi:cation diffusion facilitator CzcD-associated flavoprotein CzcO